MPQINIQEIQHDPVAFVHRIEAGEPLRIVRDQIPIAEIQPLAQNSKRPRPFGLAVGEFSVPDDFDQPLPDGFLDSFKCA